MDFYGITHTGKVRKDNQDVFRIEYDEPHQSAVLVVCDGMGGARAGNIASSMAAEVFTDAICSAFETMNSLDDVKQAAHSAVALANEKVYKKGEEDPKCRGMGTTLVALLVTPYGNLVINVGDSRAYHVRHDGITQITRDHSVVAELVSQGKITKAEAYNHPNKNLITRAIGTAPEIAGDLFEIALGQHDYVLLCSDGLSNMIGDQEFHFGILIQQDIGLVCDALIDLALDRGAPDNATVVLYRN